MKSENECISTEVNDSKQQQQQMRISKWIVSTTNDHWNKH